MKDDVTKDVVDHEVHLNVTQGEYVKVDEIVNVMIDVTVTKIATKNANETEKENASARNAVVGGIVHGVEVLKDENVGRNAKRIRSEIVEKMMATGRKGDTKKMKIAIVEKKEVMTVIAVKSVRAVTIAEKGTKGMIVTEKGIENGTGRSVTRIVEV